MFDITRPPTIPIPAASVILLRGDQVFFLRRHRKSSFMSDTFVFPGGKVDPDDGGFEIAALRELFEEAGVLLVRGTLGEAERVDWRRRLNAGEATFTQLLEQTGLTPDQERLHYWSRWITPSVEPKRFDARFYVAELPADQTPSFDQKETVEEVWVTPTEALARHEAGTLKLPPPQVRTMHELAPLLARGRDALVDASRARQAAPYGIMPRLAQLDGGAKMALLLPWDPEYDTVGIGEGLSMPAGHLLATGPSRFVLEGMTWRLIYAPGSPPAG